MAVIVANRVQETTTTTGTGNVALLGAVLSFRTFNAAFGVGPFFLYVISASDALSYEVGMGHLSDSTTLVRDRVIEGTNGTSLVSFSAGTKYVSCDIPAHMLDQALASAPLLFKPGYFYSSGASFSTVATVNGEARTFPKALPADGVLLNGITMEVVTTIGTAGSVFRLGIYNSDEFGLPSTLALDAGTIATETTGHKTITFTSQRFAGRIWLCSVPQGAPATSPTVRTITAGIDDSIGAPTLSGGINYIGYAATGITGALPTPFVIGTVSNVIYRMHIRVTP